VKGIAIRTPSVVSANGHAVEIANSPPVPTLTLNGAAGDRFVDASLTCTANDDDPTVDGMPLKLPATGSSTNHDGSELADQVSGPAPPAALSG
jgi:hypothetical protein